MSIGAVGGEPDEGIFWDNSEGKLLFHLHVYVWGVGKM